MPRETYVWRNGDLVLKGGPLDTGHPHTAGRRSHSALPCPYFISDHLHDIVAQHDGRVYDSKSALRSSYRSGGFEEVGNEAPVAIDASQRRPAVTTNEIGEALHKVRQGYRPELPSMAEAELED